MEFEEILEQTGGFGLYQKLLCFLFLPLSVTFVGMVYYAQLIALDLPSVDCIVPKMDNITYIVDEKQCTYSDGSSSYDCTEWKYTETYLFGTLSSSHNWLCGEAWRPYIIVTCFWIGNMVGAWILGMGADKFGRKPIVIICYLVYGVFGLASAFVTNFYGFLFLRLLVGTVHHTFAHLPYVLVVEYCTKNRRVVPLLMTMMTYTSGSLLAPALAYAVWDWSILLILSSAPCLLIILFFKFVPESPSWEIAQGRLDSAIDRLHMISKFNKAGLSHSDIENMVKKPRDPAALETEEPKGSENKEMLWSAYKYPIMRRQILTVLFVWMVGCMCYYGHSQNTSNLSKNILMSFLLGSLVEIPTWSVPLLIEIFGRKKPLIIAFILSGAAGITYCIIVTLVSSTWSLVLALFGRLVVTSAYYITLQYVPETFPTLVRGQGVAISETMGGIAIFVSPMIVYLNDTKEGLPLLIFGVLGGLAALVTLLLPETKGLTLPDTLGEAENLAKNKKQALEDGKK